MLRCRLISGLIVSKDALTYSIFFSLDAHGKYVVAADDNDNHPHGVVLMKNSIFLQLVMVKKQLAYVIFRMHIFVCIMPIT